MQIASDSHHISVIYVYDTDGGGVEAGWGWGVVRSTTERKNKQVSKVMKKISASETNVLIMRVAG